MAASHSHQLHSLHYPCSQQQQPQQQQLPFMNGSAAYVGSGPQQHEMLMQDDIMDPFEGDAYDYYSPGCYLPPQIGIPQHTFATTNTANTPTYVRPMPSHPHYAYHSQCLPQPQPEEPDTTAWYPAGGYCLPKTNYMIHNGAGRGARVGAGGSDAGAYYCSPAPSVCQYQMQQQQPPQQQIHYNNCIHHRPTQMPRMPFIIQQEQPPVGEAEGPTMTIQAEVTYHYYAISGRQHVQQNSEDDQQEEDVVDDGIYEMEDEDDRHHEASGVIIQTDNEEDDQEETCQSEATKVNEQQQCTVEIIMPEEEERDTEEEVPTPGHDMEASSISSATNCTDQSAATIDPPSVGKKKAKTEQRDSKKAGCKKHACKRGRKCIANADDSASSHDGCSTEEEQLPGPSSVVIEEVEGKESIDSSKPPTSPGREGQTKKEEDTVDKTKVTTTKSGGHHERCPRKTMKPHPPKIRKVHRYIHRTAYCVNAAEEWGMSSGNRDYEVRPSAYMAKEGYLVEEPVDEEGGADIAHCASS